MAITIDLPPDLEATLRQEVGNLDASAKETVLVDLYRRRVLTQAQFARALGMSRLQSDAVLKRLEVYYDITAQDVAAESRAPWGQCETNMLIVADTSPLNYLVLINAVDILPRLYGRIIIPPQVYSELQHPDTPPVVRAWAAAKPDWLELRPPSSIDLSLPLDLGEAAAIALAGELGADRLLMDEHDGRQIARRLGIAVAGTLAVLKDGANAGLVDLDAAFARLKNTSFRASPELFAEMLAEHHANRPQSGP